MQWGVGEGKHTITWLLFGLGHLFKLFFRSYYTRLEAGDGAPKRGGGRGQPLSQASCLTGGPDEVDGVQVSPCGVLVVVCQHPRGLERKQEAENGDEEDGGPAQARGGATQAGAEIGGVGWRGRRGGEGRRGAVVRLCVAKVGMGRVGRRD